MLNISDLTSEYVNSNFQPELKDQVLNSFMVLESMGVKFYEDKLIELISLSEAIEKDEVRDLFVKHLKEMLYDIIKQHNITLDLDQEVTLEDLNEIVHFLIMVQTLDDNSFLGYRLFSDDTPKKIFIDLLTTYSHIPVWKSMTIIEEVSDSLIEAMKNLLSDQPQSEETAYEKWLQEWVIFQNFIDKSDCLGNRLEERGFSKLPFKTLLALTPVNWGKEVDENILSGNLSLAALNILSFLYLSEDGQQVPLMVFDKNSSEFSQLNQEYISRLRGVLVHILSDFKVHRDAYLKAKDLTKEGRSI